MFQTNVVEKINTHILCSTTFISENHIVYEIIWKNIVEPDSPQMAIYHCACAWHAGYLRLQTHTQST